MRVLEAWDERNVHRAVSCGDSQSELLQVPLCAVFLSLVAAGQWLDPSAVGKTAIGRGVSSP